MKLTAVQQHTKNLILPNKVNVSGPYYKFSSPYGSWTTLHRDTWFVSKKLFKRQQKTEIQKILGETSLGIIIKFRDKRTYIIDQLYPHTSFKSLQKAINFLIKNEGKLVFCT